jgi:glycosyltransferase involved in cell wall biosynthesis
MIRTNNERAKIIYINIKTCSMTYNNRKNMKKKVWINWETHRRSSELSKALGFRYFCFDYKGLIRYPVSLYKTINILIKMRPKILIVQNPSMILAGFACFCKKLFNIFLIVDRHSTFRLNKPHSGSLRTWLFMKVHFFTLKNADITIVTNNHLSGIVKKSGGNPFILPDKLPSFTHVNNMKLNGKKVNMLMISSFGNDEPIAEVIEAMSQLVGKYDVMLYVSGDYRKHRYNIEKSCPENVVLTGYLSEQKYIDLLYSVDGVIVLTTSDSCMLCGCYEAVAAEKPLITSDKEVLCQYFYNAMHVKNNSKDISESIIKLICNIDDCKEKVKKMKIEIEKSWRNQCRKLCHAIEEQINNK